MINFVKTKLLLFLLLMNSTYCIAQFKTNAPLNKNIIGINTSYHFLPDRGPFMIGASYERGFTRHSGIEAGAYHHSANTYTQFYVTSQLQYNIAARLRYINIPVFYKYYSGIVNVAAGPAINILTGWKQTGSSEAKVTKVKESPRLGYQIKVGKTFELSNGFILEPEARYLNLSFSSDPFIGVGIGIKRRL